MKSFIALVMLFSFSSEAEPVQLFRCSTPLFSLEQDFQQGSLVVVKVYYDPASEAAELVSLPAVGGPVVIYPFSSSKRVVLDAKTSANSFQWKSSSASMVYLGDFTWALAAEFDNEARELDPMLPEETELICDETADFLLYANE